LASCRGRSPGLERTTTRFRRRRKILLSHVAECRCGVGGVRGYAGTPTLSGEIFVSADSFGLDFHAERPDKVARTASAAGEKARIDCTTGIWRDLICIRGTWLRHEPGMPGACLTHRRNASSAASVAASFGEGTPQLSDARFRLLRGNGLVICVWSADRAFRVDRGWQPILGQPRRRRWSSGDSRSGLPGALRSGSCRLGRAGPCRDRFLASTRDIPGNPQPHLTKRLRRRRLAGRASQTFSSQKLRRVDPAAPGTGELGG